jgi:hypothetical protein
MNFGFILKSNYVLQTLGKVGKVVRAVDNGDKVVAIENRVLVFNPNALILESKEEERVPIGQGIPPESSASVGGQFMLRKIKLGSTCGRGQIFNIGGMQSFLRE